MDKPSLADRIIAPLIWLERSRGWKRRGLTLLYLAIVATIGAIGWRQASLWQFPDAPEPFDLARYGRVEVSDADNAMVAYGEVFAKCGYLDAANDRVDVRSWGRSDWTAAGPEVRRWAEDHRQALEEWLPANDRPDSLLVQPAQMRMRTNMDRVQNLRPYVRLALLEGSRLEQSGDLAGAWRMYRGALRASRHVGRHGEAIQRFMGYGMLNQSRIRIEPWIDHPGITSDLLRRAIADVEACRAMISPPSEMVRADYFSSLDAIGDTDGWRKLGETGPYSNLHWYNQFAAGRWAYRFLRREPERSARILRLITAGYLAQCDRPSSQRPGLVFPFLMIYGHDARTPRPVRALSPGALVSWAKDSIVLELGPFSPQVLGRIDAERGVLEGLALKMAERAFVIEHGRPPKTYGKLVGRYLQALPGGIGLDDPVHPE